MAANVAKIDSNGRNLSVTSDRHTLYSTLFTISGREKNNNRKIHMHPHTH